MSLKSFDDFCARIVNNEPLEQKAIYDERQSLVRSQLTTRALWLFVITSCVNILVMECGARWGESWVLSTAIFGAAAYLYWVCANSRKGTLFGLNGTIPILHQVGFMFGEAIVLPLVLFSDKKYDDLVEHFFVRNGMVSEYFAMTLAGALYLAACIVLAVSAGKFKKREREESDNEP